MDEELGIALDLETLGTFEYRAFDRRSGLIEHELVNVFAGVSDETARPNPEEIGETRMLSPYLILADLAVNPAAYTPWLRSGLEMANDWWRSGPEPPAQNVATDQLP